MKLCILITGNHYILESSYFDRYIFDKNEPSGLILIENVILQPLKYCPLPNIFLNTSYRNDFVNGSPQCSEQYMDRGIQLWQVIWQHGLVRIYVKKYKQIHLQLNLSDGILLSQTTNQNSYHDEIIAAYSTFKSYYKQDFD